MQCKNSQISDHAAKTLLLNNQGRDIVVEVETKLDFLPCPSIFKCMGIIIISEFVYYGLKP